MNKKSIRDGFEFALISLGAFGLTMTGLCIFKANAATDPLTMDARIIGAVTIDCTVRDLNYGTIIASGVVGTVTVDPSGTVTDGGGATYVSGAVPGQCEVQGNPSVPYEIDYVLNVLTGPGADMILTNAVSNNLNGDGPFIGLGTHTANLDINGADILTVGATVNVGVNQTPGLYTGTIDITVDYP